MTDHEAAREAIHDLLQTYAATLSGLDQPGLGDWVFVASFQDLESDKNRLVSFGSANLLVHQRTGLLHEALHGDMAELD